MSLELARKIIKLYRQLQTTSSVERSLLYDVQQDLVELGREAIITNKQGMDLYDEATIADVTRRWTIRVNELARARAPERIIIAIDNLLNELHTDATFLDQIDCGVAGNEIYGELVTLVDRINRAVRQ